MNTITGRGRTRGGARGRGTRGRGPTRSKPSQQASPQQQDTETLQSEQCKPCQQYIPKQITYVRSTPRLQNEHQTNPFRNSNQLALPPPTSTSTTSSANEYYNQAGQLVVDHTDVNCHFVTPILGAFSSTASRPRQRKHLQCATFIQVQTPSNTIVEAQALFDTGSILCFTTQSFMRRINCQASGVWRGSIKTITGINNVNSPFYEFYLQDCTGGRLHCIRAVGSESIGFSNELEITDFLRICQMLAIPPNIVRRNQNAPISVLLGLECLSILAQPITRLNGLDINYPAITKDLRVWSTPLSSQLFFAGVYDLPAQTGQDEPQSCKQFFTNRC